MGFRDVGGQQFSAGVDAGNEPFGRMAQPHATREIADDGAPVTVVQMPGNAFVHDDFDVALGLADKNQYARAPFGVVQFLLKKLAARQVARTPMPYARRDQPRGDRRNAKNQAQHHERGPLQHQQGIRLHAGHEEVRQCRHQQRNQARPQQGDVTVVVCARRQDGDDFGVCTLFGTGHGVFDLPLLRLCE